jgi:hypothetical protein
MIVVLRVRERFELRSLKMRPQFPERWKDYQLAGTRDDWFMLQLPGVLVRDVNGI